MGRISLLHAYNGNLGGSGEEIEWKFKFNPRCDKVDKIISCVGEPKLSAMTSVNDENLN